MFEEGARDEDPTRDSTIAPLHSTISVTGYGSMGGNQSLRGGAGTHDSQSHTSHPTATLCMPGYPLRHVLRSPAEQGVRVSAVDACERFACIYLTLRLDRHTRERRNETLYIYINSTRNETYSKRTVRYGGRVVGIPRKVCLLSHATEPRTWTPRPIGTYFDMIFYPLSEQPPGEVAKAPTSHRRPGLWCCIQGLHWSALPYSRLSEKWHMDTDGENRGFGAPRCRQLDDER